MEVDPLGPYFFIPKLCLVAMRADVHWLGGVRCPGVGMVSIGISRVVWYQSGWLVSVGRKGGKSSEVIRIVLVHCHWQCQWQS